MKVVIQRVNRASVSVDGKTVGKIDKGLFVLVGVGQGDEKKDAEELAEKLSKLRVMSDQKGKMNLSVKDINASVLAVSQFTLHADTSKGNRPSFVKAADPNLAEILYRYFIKLLKEKGVKVETGEFGAYMMIECTLEGPVTIMLDSSK
jgi:D-tyrosyl-tRNA(Tyr) deacylase